MEFALIFYPFVEVETPPCDANKNEVTAMPFVNMNSTEIVTLEVKLDIPPNCGYPSFNEVIQKFTQHCIISQPSRVSCMIMGENCVTVKFQVPASTLPILERKITDSEQFLSRMKISIVKILDKTVFESDSGKNMLLKVHIKIIIVLLLICLYLCRSLHYQLALHILN